jgi:murein DD-endopeptidase MepM/ murein hydrolase activator NlpD
MSFTNKPKITYIYCALLLGIALFIANTLFYKPHTQPNLPKEYYVDDIIVNEGDTLSKILAPYKVSAQDILKITEITKPRLDITSLRIGQALQVKYRETEHAEKFMVSLQADIDNRYKIKIYKDNDNYKINDIIINYKRDIIKVDGQIQDNIMGAALKAGVPLKNLLEIINTYSYQIDFQRELREGDKFTVLFEKFISEDSKTAYFGKTLFSSLNLRGSKYNMYRFKLTDGTEDFFDENYSSVKRSLIKTPVMAARITSKFGTRKHPISGFTKMHQGVDFAAPAGTPIYAAGNGIVAEIGRKGAYGKYIKIRHGNDLHTAYGHARSFAKGLIKGAKVKQGQIIAYVGATGRTTGPHLHYEVMVKGKKINPLRLKLTPIIKLSGENKDNFIKYKETIDVAANTNQLHVLASLHSYRF